MVIVPLYIPHSTPIKGYNEALSKPLNFNNIYFFQKGKKKT